MKGPIIQGAEILARDWLTIFLFGLGITFSPVNYLGGLFLALAGASAATRWDKENEPTDAAGRRRDIFGTMVVAFFISHIAAICFHWAWPSLPIQFVMGVAGFGSRPLARAAVRFFGRIEYRGDQIADRTIDRFIPPHRPPATPPRTKRKNHERPDFHCEDPLILARYRARWPDAG